MVHLAWVTKYRYPVLRGDIQKRCRELIIQICDAEDVQILKGDFQSIVIEFEDCSNLHYSCIVQVNPHISRRLQRPNTNIYPARKAWRNLSEPPATD